MSPMPASSWNFTPKHRWSFQNNAICGICLFAWLELLYVRRRHVDWLRYWQRVAFVTAIAVLNSALSVVEAIMHGRAIEKQKIDPRPVFILGHPRTGTTLLHSLMALDDATFGYCSTFCVAFPSAFLWLEPVKFLFAGLVSEKRPMDEMALDLDTPQEDELGVNVLSAGTSPYMPLTFMTDEPSFRPYFSFKNAPEADKRRWTAAFIHLLRKLSLRCGGKRLLLKSPVHTARVALLLQLFPEASFVYLHRHPLVVYQSACHMADTTYWHMYLAQPTNAQIHDFILEQFVTLWEEYAADRALIPAGRLVEMSFEELSTDPTAAVGRVYAELGLSGFDECVKQRVASLQVGQPHGVERGGPKLKGYQKNAHKPLPAGLRELVAEKWEAYSKAWGYSCEEGAPGQL
jgi:LPS sulfotransferase NodH